MYIISLIIISIVMMEIYCLLKITKPTLTVENSKIEVISKNDNLLFDKYIVKEDKKIKHNPGKILIKEDYNIFINTSLNNMLVKKGYVYKIDTVFEIEIVNTGDENIIYYYIDNVE